MYYMIAWYGGAAYRYPGAEVRLFDNKEDAEKAIAIIKSQKDKGYGLRMYVVEVASVDLYIQDDYERTFVKRRVNKNDVNTVDSVLTEFC